MDLLLLIFATAALHRLWNQEVIFAWARTLMARHPRLFYPLRCATCNAMWFALLGFALWAPESAGPLAGLRTVLVVWLGVVAVHAALWRLAQPASPAPRPPQSVTVPVRVAPPKA